MPLKVTWRKKMNHEMIFLKKALESVGSAGKILPLAQESKMHILERNY